MNISNVLGLELSNLDMIKTRYNYNFKAKGTVAAGLYGSSGITSVNKKLQI